MKLILFIISVVILWKYGKISTQRNVRRMTRTFLKEYSIFKEYFEKNEIPNKSIFKYDRELIVYISPKLQMKFSSYSEMRAQFRQCGRILLRLLEDVELSKTEEYKNLAQSLVEIRHSILYSGEEL